MTEGDFEMSGENSILNKSCAASTKTESISDFEEDTYSVSTNNETETASVIAEIKNRKPNALLSSRYLLQP